MRIVIASAVVMSVVDLAYAGGPVVAYDFTRPQPVGQVVNTGSLGAGTNGTLGGNATVVTPGFDGTGGCLALDGAGDFVSIPNTFNYAGVVTVEAWINPTQLNGQRIIFDDYGNPGVLFATVGNKLQWNVSTAANPGIGIGSLAGTLQLNVWQHVAGVYDGSAIRSYVNGVLVACVTTSGAIQNNGSPSAIGSDNISTGQLNYAGQIDAFRIHLDALTPAQLADGYFVKHPPKVGDLDGDGIIGALDLGIFLGSWGPCPVTCCIADFNGDGVVDAIDMGMLLGSWS